MNGKATLEIISTGETVAVHFDNDGVDIGDLIIGMAGLLADIAETELPSEAFSEAFGEKIDAMVYKLAKVAKARKITSEDLKSMKGRRTNEL